MTNRCLRLRLRRWRNWNCPDRRWLGLESLLVRSLGLREALPLPQQNVFPFVFTAKGSPGQPIWKGSPHYTKGSSSCSISLSIALGRSAWYLAIRTLWYRGSAVCILLCRIVIRSPPRSSILYLKRRNRSWQLTPTSFIMVAVLLSI